MGLEKNIRDRIGDLTAAERKAATAMLADYPFAGLLTLAELSKKSRASSPTILRLVSKLGFSGYGDFQRAVIGEIKEAYHSPLILHDVKDQHGIDDSFLSDLSEASIEAMRETVSTTSGKQFDAICELIADRKRSIFLTGGRMSYTLAMFLFRHLRQIRSKVFLIPEYEEDWPGYLLRMGKKDVVIAMDFRRYQPNMEKFAKFAAKDRGAKIVLFTDKWLSPISKYSAHTLPVHVDVGTPWDTNVGLLLLIEAVINRVSEDDWDATRKRIEAWDQLRNTSGLAIDDELPK
ncbi:MAG: MurR/RpiR family transcriptional regulator [Rhodospirillales bacterium]|jgi:DNA-binding MurR/RpiR family transcriptional regulator|nr:MurR/RpiR family transcriptional regulator [Rhodospirillales bacterium]MBT4627384.1 MurR/RpiR family transcriptional regulator [Rhodospirillales bacterium]MBT5351120.1 MurR/RpiR family transcriptional regulator [Rhodospirillales bacterium]MBT6109083.1 MurR/RpiR family transcriptional regulator [Rhodospirillales bacterium]MBT7145582.1 MurR/RpiR family transcriptional regulator [Rhodospirillales bacterium]